MIDGTMLALQMREADAAQRPLVRSNAWQSTNGHR
jgi:hypothetical protein